MKKLVLLALALGSLAVACAPPTTINITPAGGGDGGNGGNGGVGGGVGGAGAGGGGGFGGEPQVETAHDVYVNEVHPSLIQTCGGCHNPDGQVGAPAFLDYDAELSYPLSKAYPGILTQPASSILITKEPHDGPALSDTQQAIVGNWLSMELSGSGGGSTSSSSSTGSGTGSMGPATLEDMLGEFASCMDYDIWTSSGMDEFPLQQTTGDGPCMSCHATGAGAVWLSGDSLETFDKNKMFPYVMRLVTPIYDGADPVDLALSTRLINKGKELCQNPPICHPKFELTPANKAALENFVGTTLAKMDAGACPKP
jgi:hypothetical protein